MTGMRTTVIAIAIAVLGSAGASGAAPAAAEAKVCRHNLFLKSGIGPVRVQRVSCRTAIRSLRTWVRRGMRRPGPPGWRCRMRRIGDEAPYVKARCSRRQARMRFEIGG